MKLELVYFNVVSIYVKKAILNKNLQILKFVSFSSLLLTHFLKRFELSKMSCFIFLKLYKFQEKFVFAIQKTSSNHLDKLSIIFKSQLKENVANIKQNFPASPKASLSTFSQITQAARTQFDVSSSSSSSL